MAEVKYPKVKVQLTGKDGNAFAIIGRVSAALRRKASEATATEFRTAAIACKNYNNLLALCMEWVDVQ